MRTSDLLRFALVLILAGLVLGCQRKLPEELKSPYQEALEAYYRGLDGSSLAPALAEVDAVIDRNPGDLEARALRAQILFQQYRDQPEAGRRVQLFHELRTLDRALRTGGGRQDWVRPRLYVTVGDYLLFDGARLLNLEEVEQGNVDLNFWQAYTHFLGAHRYYALTESIAAEADSASRGLRRERQHAEDGLIRALAGIVEATSAIDIDRAFPAVDRRHQDALRRLEQRLSGIAPPVELPSRSLLGLEASDQNIAAGLFAIRSSERRVALAEACAAPDTAAVAPEELWAQSHRELEQAAFHYLMEGLLTGREPDGYAPTIQLMNVLFKQPGPCR